MNAFIAIIAAVIFAILVYQFAASRKKRTRNRIAKTPFPEEWRKILRTKVQFYVSLADKDKRRFEEQIQFFLAEKRITGIKTDVSDTDRMLVASSAVIPIFGFDEWEYTNLNEVLLYPESFGADYTTEGKDRNILGMVGTGVMNNMMILSRADLRRGFENPRDKKNVGIHEFVHLIDKADGLIDGRPDERVDHAYAQPWLRLIHRKMQEIIREDSDINSYGGTSEEEFFAVASEYFFERPAALRSKHPELYTALSKTFNQDTASFLKSAFSRQKKKIGRNDRCPCDSGRKFKRCCGARGRKKLQR